MTVTQVILISPHRQGLCLMYLCISPVPRTWPVISECVSGTGCTGDVSAHASSYPGAVSTGRFS